MKRCSPACGSAGSESVFEVYQVLNTLQGQDPLLLQVYTPPRRIEPNSLFTEVKFLLSARLSWDTAMSLTSHGVDRAGSGCIGSPSASLDVTVQLSPDAAHATWLVRYVTLFSQDCWQPARDSVFEEIELG